ncbi:HAD-IA family hydrolase [Crossiella sp. SN42]|uniref:HAD-IA family hydrolase n=1 Tax=Crossiella sp. SN42 TaxID=2944808 RepID=UPI00207D35FB|nr:HAD-IA family hydrolase [Crossiella sp. SN42]MCO1574474.1 HAD-IA family hydrolase [Crossiella sp. SN42]
MTSRHIPCRAVLFDCDGVLVDSTGPAEDAWRQWAIEHGLDPEVVLDGMHGVRSQDTVAKYLPEDQRAAGNARIEEIEVSGAEGTVPIAGIPALLAGLPENWAVVTSATLPLLRARLAAAGLPLPSVVVTAELVGAGKPDPEGYLLAARRLGVPIGECVVVEDSAAGIQAGLAAGAGHVLGVGKEEHLDLAHSAVPDLTGVSWDGAGLRVG